MTSKVDLDITEQIKGRLSPNTYLQDMFSLAQGYPLLASGRAGLKVGS